MKSNQLGLNGSFRVQELEVKFKPNRKRAPVDIYCPSEVHKFLVPYISAQPREKFIVLTLAGNGVVGMEVVSQGTSDTTLVSPKEVFKAALLTNANAIIVAHNHPSGQVEPSQNDKVVCRSLKQAAEILDVRLLDFLVLAKDKYYSFVQEGELEGEKI